VQTPCTHRREAVCTLFARCVHGVWSPGSAGNPNWEMLPIAFASTVSRSPGKSAARRGWAPFSPFVQRTPVFWGRPGRTTFRLPSVWCQSVWCQRVTTTDGANTQHPGGPAGWQVHGRFTRRAAHFGNGGGLIAPGPAALFVKQAPEALARHKGTCPGRGIGQVPGNDSGIRNAHEQPVTRLENKNRE
jgi:hypothetical protein